MQIKLLVLALLTLTGAGSAAAQVNQALDVAIPEAPNIVRVGAAVQLVYELHLTNFSGLPLRLDELSINEGGEGATLKSYSGDELARVIGRVGPAETDAPLVAPGRRPVLYINAPIPAAAPPASTAHRLPRSQARSEGKWWFITYRNRVVA